MKTQPLHRSDRGFALIATLSLMVLLSVIAIGLLTLSGISLRASGAGEASATARGNARLALMIALGELQKTGGPDQRITAAANITDADSSPAITGVWESWTPNHTGPHDYDSRKAANRQEDETADGEFVGWLASGEPGLPSQPPGEPSPTGTTVTLVSDRSTPDGNVRGVHLPPSKVNANGALAWTVIDEGVKARIDLGVESPQQPDNSRRSARLTAPARPAVEAISETTAGLRLPEDEIAGRVVSLDQGELKTGGNDTLLPYFHDLTSHSLGLPVNVADGGIKADLTRAFEASSLPSELASRYIGSNDRTALAPGDARFSTLAAYYKLNNTVASGDPVPVTLPAGYVPYQGTNKIPRLASHDGVLLAPVISRVQVVFSLISRVGHGHWAGAIQNDTNDPQRNRMIYLMYNPVITVTNPYSVPLRFGNMKVTFRNIPVAFKFYRNGVAQTHQPSMLSQYHISSENRNDWDDPFTCTLSLTPGEPSGEITLAPGEARIFGTSHKPNATWNDMENYLWQNNLQQSRTLNVFSGPSWDHRGGYIVDWLRPNISGRTTDNANLGVFGVRPTDLVDVEVFPKMPGSAAGKFSIDIVARVGGSDNVPVGIYEYTYGSETKLKQILEEGEHPTLGKVTYPFRREAPILVSDITLANADHTPIGSWGSVVRPFAVFSLASRTSHDSLYAGKPGRDSSFVHHVLQMNATRNHPGTLPMELTLLPIKGSGSNTAGSIEDDDLGRAFFFSGNRRDTGCLHHVSQTLPANAPVNLADFRHANLSGSGHLPLFPRTVGESTAHPILPADKARHSNTKLGHVALDHRWLANRTLWDGYFLSGVRNANDASLLFANQRTPLTPRLTPVISGRVTTTDAEAKALAPDAWSDIASMLALKGAFNVNSTSKQAWKAVLASLRGLQIPVYGPVEMAAPGGAVIDPLTLGEVTRTSNGAPFPRSTRPISEAIDANSIDDNHRRWSGYRDLNDSELDLLAEHIVEEVRERGPFLSMADFVNRRLVSATDEKSRHGALEAAIRKSGINDFGSRINQRMLTEADASAMGFTYPQAAVGDTEEGAAMFLSQGDVLSAIGSFITVRSDTFVIRAYGDARSSKDGKVLATAWCEAVVQRLPAYVDPTDAPEKVQSALPDDADRRQVELQEANRRFGRRFEIQSFRWLHANEI